MAETRGLRRFAAGIVSLVAIAAIFVMARDSIAAPSSTLLAKVASAYKFRQLPIAMPPGYRPLATIRPVNPAYYHLRSWISSVGASVALNDVTGHGRDDGMCIVDTRTNDVIVTYAPTAPGTDQFVPFVLNPSPLPMNSTMAPMGCAPGDFTGDGKMGFLVYYWGRTPILFLPRSGFAEPSARAYKPVELVPEASNNGQYDGPYWNTNAVDIADFAGTGHPDIFIGNYFPDSQVLNPHGIDNVQMTSSLSDGTNGGGDYVYRWLGATSGRNPTVRYAPAPNAIPYKESTGWTLAAASADLTGNGLPDLYIANDFGPDHLLYNVSTPAVIKFTLAIGQRTPTTPKSFVLGKDSFKGMGADFADLADNGRFDAAISNITTAYGLEESNFVWMNNTSDHAAMTADLRRGVAPFSQDAEQLGMAWTGWGWDLKAGDFLNSGNLDVVQTDGFVKGKIDRWPWLQEMAMNNDNLLTNPADWPVVVPGDDISGHQCLAFYAKAPTGRYANISKNLGLCVKTPTRGVAIADTTASGALDFAVSRQWGPPAFYANQSPHLGHYLGLELYRPAVGGGVPGRDLEQAGSPAYGATAQIFTPGGHTQITQLDGGGGGDGKRSFELYFGLGNYDGPVLVHLSWRGTDGVLHHSTLRLNPGTHDLMLTSTAREG
jgi:enediyne biosynthesis protein E4